MLEDFPRKVHSKLKSRARKGIPDSFRGTAWKSLACIDEIKEELNGKRYEDFLRAEAKKQSMF